MICAERRGRQFRRGRSMLERYQVWAKSFAKLTVRLGVWLFSAAPRQRSTAEIPLAMARYHDIKHFTHGAHTGL